MFRFGGMQEFLCRNFGPIVNQSSIVLKINKVTVLCGKQGAGKSTIAKMVSVFTWLEKALVRGDYSEKELLSKGMFREKICSYHRIQSYFRKDTYFFFKGKKYVFVYDKDELKIQRSKRSSNYMRPQVMYIPSERNLMTAVEDADKIQGLPSSLSALVSEYYRALKSFSKPITLPIDNYEVSYEESTKTAWFGNSSFKIKMTEAASGFQSMVPMLIISRYLLNKIKSNKKGRGIETASEIERSSILDRVSKILNDKMLSDVDKRKTINQIIGASSNGCLINIVEEPEQNLYPESQRIVLNELLKINYGGACNQLLLTTHSPYMLNYLSLAVKAGILKETIKRNPNKKDLFEKISPIVPLNSSVKPQELSIYEICPNGEIKMLDNYDGVPSDGNFLNTALSETNDLFDALLEIEDEVVD